jgi:type II secretory pathway pseudopilin PulG
MRVAVGLLVAVALPSFGLSQGAAAASTQAANAAEQDERQAENARRDALLRNDTTALDRLIADSFLGTLDDGRTVRKPEQLAANRPGDRKVESWNQTDLVVRLYGETAVVTGLAAVKDRFRSEGAREFTFRFTHVWTKLDGRWQLVGRHISGRSVPRSQPQ